ncbi:hypothetical protein OR16_02025 [Cupriavidus basilensis OR16]|uniref:Uncharacterized protein n=1 Tax=Cupriavidus basilensis OR16 TaxID=1127483 RepID=H1RYQ9_9BURK|nr:hypothetical protein OR16_02025 [Cupriavidus basilensis OR16]
MLPGVVITQQAADGPAAWQAGAAGYSNDTWPEPVRLTARWCGLPATTMSPDPVSATLAASDA